MSLQATQPARASAGAAGTVEVFPSPEMSGAEGGGMPSLLNGNPVPRVDEADQRLRERQHRPGFEEFFELVAILSGQTFGQVFASVSDAAKRGSKDADAGVATTQLLVPIIHEIEAR